MKIAIRFSQREEEKALPILVRHSPGMVLQDGTYVIGVEAANVLREAGVKFTEVTSEAAEPGKAGSLTGERI